MLAQDMMQAAACFMYEFWEDLEWRAETPEDLHQAALVGEHAPQCTRHMGGRLCFLRADTLSPILQRVLPFLLVPACGPAT